MIQSPSAWQTLLGEDFSHYFHSMLLCLGLDDCGVLFMRVDFNRCEVEILRLKHDLFLTVCKS